MRAVPTRSAQSVLEINPSQGHQTTTNRRSAAATAPGMATGDTLTTLDRPTVADVRANPEYWIAGRGRELASRTDCGHGYNLTDSCPNCDADQPPFLIRVFVPGTPKPQGSKRAIVNRHTGKASLVESSAGVKTWRDDIRAAVLDAPSLHFDGPVAVHCEFVLARPRSHYRTGRNAHLVRDSAPTWPTSKPDADKLARAVLDAVSSAGTWRDDSQVVELHAVKRYARERELAGMWLTIHELFVP